MGKTLAAFVIATVFPAASFANDQAYGGRTDRHAGTIAEAETAGDRDRDGRITSADLALRSQRAGLEAFEVPAWQSTGIPADFNNDGAVTTAEASRYEGQFASLGAFGTP